MGRCYEFGAAINSACEHAMVVDEDGGRCGCATCGATCLGRFAGCADIISRPGFVPVTAPAWAVARPALAPASAANGAIDITGVEVGSAPAPEPAPAVPSVTREEFEALRADLDEMVDKMRGIIDEALAATSEQLRALQRSGVVLPLGQSSAERIVALRCQLANLHLTLREHVDLRDLP